MKYTPQQDQFFKTFGYLHFPKVFSPVETAEIISEFDRSIQEFGGGKNHDGTKRTMLGNPLEHTPRMCSILDDERITDIIGGALGEDFNYCGGDGNYYTGDTGWHPDGAWGFAYALKVAFYLDPVRKDTGCLRVLPGSHDPNYIVNRNKIDLNRSKDLFGIEPRDFPGNVPLETDPGDVLIFTHDVWHSSWGGSARRRMFTMNCIPRAKTEADFVLAKKYLSIHSAGAGNFDTGAGMFFPMMLDTADEKRMAHLEQAAAIHDELFPQFKRKTPIGAR